MKNKESIIKCADLIGYEWNEINCNTISALINGIWVIYSPFLPENAHQTNELIDKINITIEKQDMWVSHYEIEDGSINFRGSLFRNISIYKCLAAYFGMEYEE